MTDQNGKQFSIMEDEKFMEFMTDKFGRIDEQFESLENGLNKRIDEIKDRLQNVETNIVTKSFLTDKLIDLEARLVDKVKKEDTKINLLADVLVDKKVLKTEDVKKVKAIEVFSV